MSLKVTAKNLYIYLAGIGLVILFVTLLVVLGGRKKPISKNSSLDIMCISYTGNPLSENSSVKKALEDYTNTRLDIQWVPSYAYDSRFNITLASGKLPAVMFVISKSSTIINAVRAGGFWELGPYLKDYKNLSQADPKVLNNISIDGKVYGIYRARSYGRNGILYRKDWLENIGMKSVNTIDDFYSMLKGFTYNDPDRDGAADTYGMTVTSYKGTFDIMSTWFGTPNGWGEDSTGKLIPAFMTNEYLESLKFWKKIYDEKLINQDFAVYSAVKWNDPVLNGKSGVIVDVADRASSVAEKIETSNPKAVIDVIGSISGPKGYRNLPSSGYNGMFMIPKQSVKTEEELRKVLSFFDKLNDKTAQDIIWNGIENKHYKVVDGYAEKIGDAVTLAPELNDLSQLTISIPKENRYLPKQTDVRKKVDQVMKENEKYCVPNPAEPLVSNTYTIRGIQLDNIIEDARVKFIIGQINESGFKAALDLWKNSGGQDVIKEINNEYSKYKSK